MSCNRMSCYVFHWTTTFIGHLTISAVTSNRMYLREAVLDCGVLYLRQSFTEAGLQTMSTWILLGYLSVGCLAQAPTGLTCRRSYECQVNQCCRDSSNRILVEGEWGYYPSAQGHCVDGGAGPNEACDSSCQCPSGYECYRRVTGVCCPPPTCVTKAEADADRDYWRCRPPPPAPPPAGQQRQRRFLFSALCPDTTPVSIPARPQP